MDIFKIVGIALVAVVLVVVIKGQKPEIAIQISIISGIIIFTIAAPYVMSVINMLSEITSKAGIDGRHVETVLRIIGIAYIAQFASQVCKDAGEGAIAVKVEFAGKVIILAMSMPILYELLNMILKIVSAV